MRALLQQLGAEDPGILLAVGILLGAALVIVFQYVVAQWDLRR